MFEYENEKSKSTFYPKTFKSVSQKSGVIFWIGQLFHAEILYLKRTEFNSFVRFGD